MSLVVGRTGEINERCYRTEHADPYRRLKVFVGRKGASRWDHKRDHYLNHTLAEFFEWAPVCPEVEVGMGTPREAIHLVQLSGEVRLVGRQSGFDHTDAMRSYTRRVEHLKG